MIRDLTATFRKVLSQPGLPPELSSAEIVFDRPSDDFKPERNTVGLFLYDVRENTELRTNEPISERLNGQVSVRQPPMRVACSYLVTAWAATSEERALQEQRLLSQVLQVLSRYPTIPADFLQGSLHGQEPPLPLLTAQADGMKNPAEFWSALGAKLRPSLTVTATISMEVFPPEGPTPVVITEEVRLGERTSPFEEKIKPETEERFFRIGGRVTDAQNSPVEEATVTMVESGLSAGTDAEGRYTLGPLKAGAHTLRAQKDAAQKEFGITVPAPAGTNYDVQLI